MKKREKVSLNLKTFEGFLGNIDLEVVFENNTTNKITKLCTIGGISDTLIISRQVFVAQYDEKLDLQRVEDALLMNHENSYLFDDDINPYYFIFEKCDLNNKGFMKYLREYYSDISKIGAHGSFEDFELNLNRGLSMKTELNYHDIDIDKDDICRIYVDHVKGSITILLSVKYGKDDAVEKIVIKRKDCDNSNCNLSYLSYPLGDFFNKEKIGLTFNNYSQTMIKKRED